MTDDERPPVPPEKPENPIWSPSEGAAEQQPFVEMPAETPAEGAAEVFEAPAGAPAGDFDVLPGQRAPEAAAQVAEQPATAATAPRVTAEQPERPSAPASSRASVSGPAASDDDRLMGGLAWVSMVILPLPLVSLVLLISEESKHRPFQRYHGVASILFWVATFIYEMMAAVAYGILGLVTFGIGFFCLWPIFFVPHVLMLWYAWQAYQGRYSEIPVISSIARDQHWT